MVRWEAAAHMISLRAEDVERAQTHNRRLVFQSSRTETVPTPTPTPRA